MVGTVEYDLQGPHLPQSTDCCTEPPCSFCTSFPCNEPLAKRYFMKKSNYRSRNDDSHESQIRDEFFSSEEWRSKAIFAEAFKKKFSGFNYGNLKPENFNYCLSTFRNLSVVIAALNSLSIFGDAYPTREEELWHHEVFDARYMSLAKYNRKTKVFHNLTVPSYSALVKKFCCSEFIRLAKGSECNIRLEESQQVKRTFEQMEAHIDEPPTCSNLPSSTEGDVPMDCVPNEVLLKNCTYPYERPRHGVGYSTASIKYNFRKQR